MSLIRLGATVGTLVYKGIKAYRVRKNIKIIKGKGAAKGGKTGPLDKMSIKHQNEAHDVMFKRFSKGKPDLPPLISKNTKTAAKIIIGSTMLGATAIKSVKSTLKAFKKKKKQKNTNSVPYR